MKSGARQRVSGCGFISCYELRHARVVPEKCAIASRESVVLPSHKRTRLGVRCVPLWARCMDALEPAPERKPASANVALLRGR